MCSELETQYMIKYVRTAYAYASSSSSGIVVYTLHLGGRAAAWMGSSRGILSSTKKPLTSPFPAYTWNGWSDKLDYLLIWG